MSEQPTPHDDKTHSLPSESVWADTPNLGYKEGDRIGPYHILGEIGEGGFGVVYLAERREPHVQRVALKVIRPGMDARHIISRFEHERQALAVMDHPNVARVFDGGTTDQHLPYFAMEYVKGDAITRYCDREALSLKERIELFIPICEAVQHAHHKGIIHRDLKPSNILVAIADGKLIPKVIDFGLAKAMNQAFADRTIFTGRGELMGTPDYMSPEQAEMGATDVDTRTDIYSLGVILYQLLCGHLPFDPGSLRKGGIARIVREVDPPKPSTRVGGAASPGEGAQRGTRSEDDPAWIAKSRRVDSPTTLSRRLRGDLDWIVMKCLEKDRTRRYETANGLAIELQRYLNNEPVSAGPPSVGYRVRKFVSRNKGSVTAALLVVTTLIAATIVSIAFAIEAESERGKTATALSNLEVVSDFQADQLSAIEPHLMGERLREDIIEKYRAALSDASETEASVNTAVQTLDHATRAVNFTDIALRSLYENLFVRALAVINEQFVDQPAVKAALLQAISSTMRKLGLLAEAQSPQREALQIRRALHPNGHADLAFSLTQMANLLQYTGDYSCAQPYFEEALGMYQQTLEPGQRRLMNARRNVGYNHWYLNELDEAATCLRDVLKSFEMHFGPDDPDTVSAYGDLGALCLAMGQLNDAEVYLADAVVRLREIKGDEDRDTLVVINDLQRLRTAQGRFGEAETLAREVWEARKRTLGEDHSDTLQALNNLGSVLSDARKYDEAEKYVREALERRRKTLGEDHPQTLSSLNNWAFLMQQTDRLDEAEDAWRETLRYRRKILTNDHRLTIQTAGNLGALLSKRGNLIEAHELCAEALERAGVVLGPGHFQTGIYHGFLGRTLSALGQHRDAEAHAFDSHSILVAEFGESHHRTAAAIQLIIDLYTAWHEAEPDGGYDAKAAKWRAKFDEIRAESKDSEGED